MCEINPKHRALFRLEAFTSQGISEEKFSQIVCAKLAEIEQALNADNRIRFHIHGPVNWSDPEGSAPEFVEFTAVCDACGASFPVSKDPGTAKMLCRSCKNLRNEELGK